MRIVLEMFQGDYKMSSGTINVPEDTGHELRMRIHLPTMLPVKPWKDGAVPIDPDMVTQVLVECVFLYTGTRTPNGVMIYFLNDIRGVSRNEK